MCCLWSQGDEVPHSIGILQVCGGVSLLSVDEGREQNGVSDEEDWSVVAN